MKILVVDNDAVIREGLVQLILQEAHDLSELQQATGVSEGLAAIRSFQPDLVFLDVEMDDGTGFDLLNQLTDISFQLVFITAHNKYAVNAFKFSAIDFLLKPIDRQELIDALKKVSEQVAQKDIASQLSILRNTLNQLHSSDQKIVLKDSKSMYFVRIEDIMNCESEGSYLTFHLTDGKKIVVCKSMKEYEQLLEPFLFVRTHHSHLVNIRKIARIDKTEGGTLVLENGAQIPMSQRKRDQIIALLNG